MTKHSLHVGSIIMPRFCDNIRWFLNINIPWEYISHSYAKQALYGWRKNAAQLTRHQIMSALFQKKDAFPLLGRSFIEGR